MAEITKDPRLKAQPNREITQENVHALSRFLRDWVDPAISLSYDPPFVKYHYNGRAWKEVNVGGDSFIGCLKDVIKRLE